MRPATERRRGERREVSAAEPHAHVKLRTGRELLVLDASDGGLLVEGDVRLLPGTHLDLHVVTPEGRRLVRVRVVRAWVAALSASVVVYRGAFAFEQPVSIGATAHRAA